MNRCTDSRFEEMLYAYEIGILSDSDREQLELHLMQCESCMKSVRSFSNVAELLKHDHDVKRSIKTLDQESTIPNRKRWKFITPVSIAAAAVFILLLLKDWSIEIKPTQEAFADLGWQSSVAVMPFDDLSQEQDQAYFCAGMAEEIISRLSRIPELKVISRSAVMTLAGSNLSIAEIASELKVKTVLTGSIRREGNQLRIITQLVDARDGTQLWSKQMDATLESVFAIQDEVSKDIAAALQVQLAPHQISLLAQNKQPSLEAYEHYLRGLHYVLDKFVPYKRIEDFEAGVLNLRRAIAIDSTYGTAYAGLGFAYAQYNEINRSRFHDSLCLHYLKVAFELDSTSALPLLGRGYIAFRADSLDEALARFKAALEIEPNLAPGNRMMADFYRAVGLFVQAEVFYRRAIELAPFFIWSRGMYTALLFDQNRIDEADSQLAAIERINPNDIMYLSRRAWIAIAQNDFIRAREIIARCDSIWFQNGTRTSRNGSIRLAHAHLYAAQGMADSAFALIDTTRLSRYHESIYALLGMNDRAIDHMERRLKLVDQRGGYYRLFEIETSYLSLIGHPFLSRLRGDVRYDDLIHRQRQAYEANLVKYQEPVM